MIRVASHRTLKTLISNKILNLLRCWRRGSNEKVPLKTRKLLILRKARNAKSAVSAISWHVYGTRSARTPK